MRYLLLLIILSSLFLFGCTEPKTSDHYISVSNDAIASIAKEIIGDKYEIIVIMPSSANPHTYEPSALDVAKISSSDLFIYNGLIDPWASSIDSNSLDVSKGVDLIKTDQGYDPHIWLSFNNSKIIASNIANRLMELDPDNKQYYQDRLNLFIAGARRYDSYASYLFSNCKSKYLVISHPFMAYFARDYGLEQVPINKLDSSDSSAKQLAYILSFIEEHNIHYIFGNSLDNKDKIEAFASEANVSVLYLTPFSSDYFSMMANNVETIAKGLECEQS